MSILGRFSAMLAVTFLCASALAAQGISAEIQFTNPRSTVAPGEKLNLNLFSAVGRGGVSAEIRLMAAFYDAEQNLICSGIIESVAIQNNNTQSTNIEVRPLNMVEFVRLVTATNVAPKRLFCMDPEGNVEVAPTAIARAASLRLRATILPKNGGVATSEMRINF